MTAKIVSAILEIFGVFFVGWLSRRFRYIEEKDINKWSALVIDFLFPLLVFSSITQSFEADRFREIWPLPFLGLGLIVFGALCGFALRPGLHSTDPDIRKTFLHFCAINNYGFLPIIIIHSLWGAPGVAKLFFLNLGSTVGYWTIGVGVLGEHNIRKAARNIMTPSLFALALALLLCLTGLNVHVPGVVLRASASAGAAAVPLMLVLIGASLYPFPSIRNKFDIAYVTVARLALIPFLSILILLSLPLKPDVRDIAIIIALMPGTVSSTIITRRFGGSPDFAARVAIVTTLVSIATIPLALTLLARYMTVTV